MLKLYRYNDTIFIEKANIFMAIIKLFHGSDHVINAPKLSIGKPNNDYGRGFYCTLDKEMAKEWACKNNNNGYVNEYAFDDNGLKILNLLDGKHTVLNWVALLLKYRTFTINNEIALDAKKYIIDNFLIDISSYDVIIGYRADDSYFSYAQSFVHNALPLRNLSRALKLGELGTQIVLISEKAFSNLKFVSADSTDKNTYFPRFFARDVHARESYQKDIKKGPSFKDDIFVMDILRDEIKNNDPRLQQIILK